LVADLNEGQSSDRWLEVAFFFVVLYPLFLIGQACVHQLCPEPSTRRRIATVVSLTYVTWWCVLVGSLVTQPQLDVTPRQLLQTALLFQHSEPHVGPAVGLSILIAALAVIITMIRDRSSSVMTPPQSIVTSPNLHNVFTVFAYLSPGLFLF
jgi:hypothetical protein